MDFKALEQLIKETASHKKIDEESIIDDVADVIRLKYGISIMEKERELIDEVKNKIITKLYNSDEHTISTRGELPVIFKLDALEKDYLDESLNELRHEGLVEQSSSSISLTKEGVMKFKQFYGEI